MSSEVGGGISTLFRYERKPEPKPSAVTFLGSSIEGASDGWNLMRGILSNEDVRILVAATIAQTQIRRQEDPILRSEVSRRASVLGAQALQFLNEYMVSPVEIEDKEGEIGIGDVLDATMQILDSGEDMSGHLEQFGPGLSAFMIETTEVTHE